MVVQMLLGLNYMHARKILHRDFKTANVFLDKECNVRLGDLGVAKVRGSATLVDCAIMHWPRPGGGSLS